MRRDTSTVKSIDIHSVLTISYALYIIYISYSKSWLELHNPLYGNSIHINELPHSKLRGIKTSPLSASRKLGALRYAALRFAPCPPEGARESRRFGFFLPPLGEGCHAVTGRGHAYNTKFFTLSYPDASIEEFFRFLPPSAPPCPPYQGGWYAVPGGSCLCKTIQIGFHIIRGWSRLSVARHRHI